MLRRAVLFDLDDTLLDRDQTVLRVARKLARRYAAMSDGVTEERLYEAIVRADNSGYAPRKKRFTEVLNGFPWRAPPTFWGTLAAFGWQSFPGARWA